MIAVAVIAGLFALARSPVGPILVFLSLSASLAFVLWQMFRGFRRLAALAFAVVAALSNVSSAALCIYYLNLGGAVLMFLVSLITIPAILGVGAAWATTATQRTAALPRRSPLLSWPLVIALAIAPLTMLFTHWPLRLAFFASSSSMKHLADRVAAGQAVRNPEWAGLFRVVGSAGEPVKGNVGLIIDGNASGRSGFVRVGLGVHPEENDGPFYNLNFNQHMAGRWWYQNED